MALSEYFSRYFLTIRVQAGTVRVLLQVLLQQYRYRLALPEYFSRYSYNSKGTGWYC